jgi:aminoglycoside phosphotransferase
MLEPVQPYTHPVPFDQFVKRFFEKKKQTIQPDKVNDRYDNKNDRRGAQPVLKMRQQKRIPSYDRRLVLGQCPDDHGDQCNRIDLEDQMLR